MNFPEDENLVNARDDLIDALRTLSIGLRYNRVGLPFFIEVNATRELVLEALQALNDFRRETP